MTRPKKVKTPKLNNFKVNLKYLDQDQEGEFENMYDALKALGPKTIKNRVILSVERNGRRYGRVLFAPHARRVFLNDMAMRIISRNIERALPI